MSLRVAEIKRTTRETDVSLVLDLEAKQTGEITTGLSFLDHLLASMAFHGHFALSITAAGDLEVDGHHTAEDVGIALGEALDAILKKGPVARFGHAVIPMDEALAEVTIDVCGRPTLSWHADFPQPGREHSTSLFCASSSLPWRHTRASACTSTFAGGRTATTWQRRLFKALGKALQQAYGASSGEMSSKGRIG